jgi:hypothetical protein
VGLALERAAGAREMTGEPAADERVATAVVTARASDAAAMFVTTSCGNVALVGLRRAGGVWSSAVRHAFVSQMHPGRCGRVEARASAIALSSDARREVAVVVATEDVTGETVTGPFLSVYQLGRGGALTPLLANAPFGSTDDTTGATTTAEYLIVEDIPAPRDLYVVIRPGRRGPGGPPPNETTRRRYALRSGRLELVQETTDVAE